MCKHSDVFSRPVLIVRGLDIKDTNNHYAAFRVCRNRHAWHMAARHEPREVRKRARTKALLGVRTAQLHRVSGDYAGGETPLPIPNREVKPAEADGTWGEAPWESRKSPGLFKLGGHDPDRVPRQILIRAASKGAVFLMVETKFTYFIGKLRQILYDQRAVGFNAAGAAHATIAAGPNRPIAGGSGGLFASTALGILPRWPSPRSMHS